jgi:hypothetical protein
MPRRATTKQLRSASRRILTREEKIPPQQKKTAAAAQVQQLSSEATVPQLLQQFPVFMKRGGPTSCSQQPAAGPCDEHYETIASHNF